ncbi:hypothetical protein ASG30_08045 [Ramlibacter sp. Leaf400]|nr:hypothetical protein ASG30_08045 [Ramlibacter sp. Leaf400]
MYGLVKRLFERYRSYHDMDRPILQWIGVMGAIGFPLFYMLRRTSMVPPRYDDLELRAAATLLCVGLALRRWWPASWKRFYFAYSYGVVFYCLSFLLSFTSLKNQGGTLSVVNMVMATILIILVADWRNAVVMLAAGYAGSLVAYMATEPPGTPIPSGFAVAAVTSILVVAAGALSHYGQQRAEMARMRRLYSGLAGSIAHEMRNPLAQVRHALDSIAASLAPHQASGGARLAAEQLHAVMATVQQGRNAVSRGLQAIELTLQQLQPAPMDPATQRPVQALACVERAVQAYAYQDEGQRARVRIEARGDFSFRGDPTALELVLFNLLRNALYYVPLHPAMAVTITVEGGLAPRIVVRDTGPGIEPDLLSRLFQEFQTAGKAEGTGLGLAFCRRVMEGMGGRIACRSQYGEFTEFTLGFPPAEGAVQSEALAPQAAQASLAGRTVLVVDDQALNRSILRALCLTLDMRVLEAEHGQQALDLLGSGTVPDAVLMDVDMPGLDGIQTTRALRALPGRAGRVPVVAVTANDSPAVQQVASAAGLQAVLGKPVDAAMLGRTLGRVLASEHDPAAPLPAPAAAPSPAPSALLDLPRLEDFRRMGLMEELLPESLTGMRRLLQDIGDCLARDDAEGAKSALHTLVGVSGETGAQALHAMLKRKYRDWLESRPPEGTGWIDEARALLAATEEALRRQYGVVAAIPAQTSSDSLRV